MSKNNFEHEVAQGKTGEDTPQWLRAKWFSRHKNDTREKVIGSFYAHYSVWVKLAMENANDTIVCEDDAFLARPFIAKNFPSGKITLLGGTIRTPGAWGREQQEWYKNGKFMEAISEFKLGVNHFVFAKDFKYTMCLAYVIPQGMAKELVEMVRTCSKIGATDVWLGKKFPDMALHFPNVFVDMDASTSQLNSPKNDLLSDFYCSKAMVKEITKLGYTFPPRGSSIELFSVFLKEWNDECREGDDNSDEYFSCEELSPLPLRLCG
eukprot:1627806-Amphidinium_carterae.1